MRTIRNAAASAALFAIVLSLVPEASAQSGPFGAIHVAANRAQYTGRGCPIEVIFSGSINFAMPHGPIAFNYHWERSDGAKGPQQVVHVNPNQRSVVVRERWRLGAPGQHYDAHTTLYVNSGVTHLSEPSPSVQINCR